MTNFVIDGCDCVGKTTLIKEFLKHDNYEVRKCSAPPVNLNKEEQRDFCKREYERAIEYLNTHDNVIYDRCFLGEGVYAPVMRGYYPEYLRELEKKLNTNTMLIVLTASEKIVQARFDEQFITRQLIKPILFLFKAQYLLSNVKNKIMLNTSYATPGELYERIKKREHKRTTSSHS